MIVENRLSRLLLLLFLTFVFCCAFYYLPEKIAGFQVKHIDLFSDLREKSMIAAIDTMQQSWLEEDTLAVDSVALQRLAQEKQGLILLHWLCEILYTKPCMLLMGLILRGYGSKTILLVISD